MLAFALKYWVDLWVFAILATAATSAVHCWLRRTGNGGLPRLGWVAVFSVVCLAMLMAELAGTRERASLRDRLEGLAPTYAQEVQLLGHSRVRFDTPADDPTYLKIINAEIRWERVNPNVNDIYTFRRNAAGKPAFVVDSETDYDRNGTYDGPREQRTAIGEVYEQATPNFLRALDGVAGFDDEPYSDRWGTWISAYVPLYDASGKVEAALGVDFDASVWNRDIAWNRAGALGIAGLMLAIVIAAATVVTISRSEMRKREKLQRELVDASREAGMAEVATGVLHNVGNVLNSVNTSAGVLVEKVRSSKIAGLGKAAELIRDNRLDFAKFIQTDAKGKVLPDYLIRIAQTLCDEQQDMLGELSQLGRSLDHVKQIVASQQTLAKSVEGSETFELGDLIDDTLRINADAIERGQIEVDRRRINCPPITADRHLILQILVNLVSNAIKAMDGVPVRQLTLVAETTGHAELGRVVRIQVIDTGVGISADQLAKLFTHGYTTRTDGHGFGLHHSSIVAHNMNGDLTVASEGPGHGATFTLLIPLRVSSKGIPCPST
ncbi:MAG: sensor histidine kinase [Tepidisphaeraceae bacterium]